MKALRRRGPIKKNPLKRRKMKKNKAAFVLALLVFSSCASDSYYKLRVDLPTKTNLNLSQFNEIVITNFLVKKETKDVNLSKELVNYFSFELGQAFKGKVLTVEVSLKDEALFKNEDFWKNLYPERKNSILLTGSAQYSEEVRKAILETKRSRFETPFPPEKALSERKFYILNLDLYLIDTESGKALYKRSFNESKGYDNPRETAYFAFFDLIQGVKGKLFPNIVGDRKIQERYILSH
jgi:hypothetical protein